MILKQIFLDGSTEEYSLSFYEDNVTVEFKKNDEILNVFNIDQARKIEKFLIDAIDHIERFNLDDKSSVPQGEDIR